MEGFDLSKAFDELLKPTDPQERAALKNTTTAATDPPDAAALRNTTEVIDPPKPAALNHTTEATESLEPALKNTTEAIDPPELSALENTTETIDLPDEAALENTTEGMDPREAALKNTTEAPNLNSLDSILPRLPPEGAAWLIGLNRFCRRAVEHDLRVAGPNLFLQHWVYLRDTLERLERDLGPSDNWV